MTISRFIPPLCNNAESYAILVRRHCGEVARTGGWSIPHPCEEALQSPNKSKQYSAIEFERTLLSDSCDPCDDVTELWARLMCTDTYIRRCVDPSHLDMAVRSTWMCYGSEWNFLVNRWCK